MTKELDFSWVKKGRLLSAEYHNKTVESHAAIPFLHLSAQNGDSVFFSARDFEQRSHILKNTVQRKELLKNTVEILDSDSASVILGPGKLGTFDDSGCTNSWVVEIDELTSYLYYTGWSLGKSVPFTFNIGLAISNNGGKTFERYSDGPIFGRSPAEPYLLASPCVIREGNIWRMWYISGCGWESTEAGPKHFYRVRYAESQNGIEWCPKDYCLDFANDSEYAMARPSVLQIKEQYVMWFSYRGPKYKIGFATSADGINWIRKDTNSVIDAGDYAWEQDAVCYAQVTQVDSKLVMLYNGNDYGKSGVGVAVSELGGDLSQT